MKQGTHFVRTAEPPVNSGTLWVLYCHHCHKTVVTDDDAFCPECDRFVAPGLEPGRRRGRAKSPKMYRLTEAGRQMVESLLAQEKDPQE